MTDVLERADRMVGRAAGLFAWAGAVGIVLLLGVTVVAVFWRYALNAPIYGIEDISIVSLTLVAAGAVSYGARHDAHVSINLLRYVGGRRITRVTDLVMRALTATIALIAAWALVTKACGMEKACVTSNLTIEHRPFFYVLAAAMALYGLHMTIALLRGLSHWHQDEDPAEVPD